MVLIAKLKVLNAELSKKNTTPFMLPSVANQNVLTNNFLENIFICNYKEALRALFGIGRKGLTAFVKHVVHHSLQIQALTGRVTPMAAKFRENMLPSLAFFKSDPSNGMCKTYLIYTLCSFQNCN